MIILKSFILLKDPVLTPVNSHCNYRYQCLCPWREPQLPPSQPPPPRGIWYQQVGLAQSPVSSVLFSVVLVCTRPCVCLPGVEFPQSCGFPVGLQSQILWIFSTSCWQAPRLGSLMWGLELGLLSDNSCGIAINISSLCVAYISCMRFDFIVI